MNTAILEKFLNSYKRMSKANSIKLMGVDGRIVFDFTPSGDGIWLVEFINGILQPIRQETVEDYDARLTTRLEDMIRAQREHITVPDAIAQGWLKVEGNAALVSKLSQAGMS